MLFAGYPRSGYSEYQPTVISAQRHHVGRHRVISAGRSVRQGSMESPLVPPAVVRLRLILLALHDYRCRLPSQREDGQLSRAAGLL